MSDISTRVDKASLSDPTSKPSKIEGDSVPKIKTPWDRTTASRFSPSPTNIEGSNRGKI
jgi:hypothetical protein